jgi:hypothetical protein
MAIEVMAEPGVIENGRTTTPAMAGSGRRARRF